ncbi:hypothetical protein KJ680_01190, partial [bacterium]|nr:hypothetical protein [bacterium]
IKAKKVYLTLDTTTLPRGFVMTTAVNQTVEIVPGGSPIINFGTLGVSEIRGYVYNDVNLNNIIIC